MTSTVVLPNYTLYINNLNDKVSKRDLKTTLYHMFSQHGKILDIVALKTMPCRGQAFVCFNELSSATHAMRAFQGYPLFEKPMKIQYAKESSNAIRIRDGTIMQKKKEKRRNEEDEEIAVRKRIKRMEDAENANELLFVSNLPVDTTVAQLEALFNSHQGFKEVRSVPGKTDIAFVEFETTDDAAAVVEVLNGFAINASTTIKVDFARK